jgi:hypothetical protein
MRFWVQTIKINNNKSSITHIHRWYPIFKTLKTVPQNSVIWRLGKEPAFLHSCSYIYINFHCDLQDREKRKVMVIILTSPFNPLEIISDGGQNTCDNGGRGSNNAPPVTVVKLRPGPQYCKTILFATLVSTLCIRVVPQTQMPSSSMIWEQYCAKSWRL